MATKPIYSAQTRQNLFHSSAAPYRLFGGASGGGKSEAVLFEAIAICQEWPGCHGLLLRRTFPELKMSLIMRALDKLPKELYKYYSSDHVLTWLPTNSKIQFGHCEREDDVYRYQGAEFDFIGVDELTQFEEFTIKFLWSRMRTSKGYSPKFFGATNPGGIGHAWVKRLWIDHQLSVDESLAGFKEDDFVFIPSKVTDNKYINPEYIANLKMLPEHQRKMYLDGSWDVYEGKFFETFDENQHVISSSEIPENYPRFRAIDFGRTAPFCCLWFAIDYDGNVLVYREYYQAGREVDENIDEVIKLSGTEKYEYTVIDTAVFARTGFGESIGQRIQRKGVDIIPAHKDRLAGWTVLKQYMHWAITENGERRSRLRVMRSCPALIEEMKNALYDKNRPEDLNTKMPDHAVDALRYFVMTLRDRALRLPEEDKLKHINPILRARFEERQASSAGVDVNTRYSPYDE